MVQASNYFHLVCDSLLLLWGQISFVHYFYCNFKVSVPFVRAFKNFAVRALAKAFLVDFELAVKVF